MSAFALDSNHDLSLSGGQLARVTGADGFAQKVTTQLLHYLGEWWLDLLSGFPWFTAVFVSPPDISAAESAIKNVITRTPGFVALTSFEAEINVGTRLFSVTFEADTEFGPTGEVIVSA